jgi:CheY-like chemotaxis protein
MMRTLSSPLEEPTRPTKLHRWLPALITSARLNHPKHHIQLGGVPEVRIPAVQTALALAIHHVIANATEATPVGRPIQVTASTSLMEASDLRGWDASPGSFVHIQIEDAGEGMDESTMDSMLRVFQSSRHPGRGLGLPLALSIIRQHRGRVLIESAPDVGTVVTLSLPLLAPSVRQPLSIITADKPTPAVTAKTLLVADDTSAVLRATTRLLQRAGYQIVAASSGTEALAHFTAEPDRFDAVLLDANMPGYGGVHLAELLTEQRPNLAVLLVTGQPPANCPWPVLEKPYRPGQLLTLLQTLFR